MEKVIKGKVYVMGQNIDTDQIIPAKYLMYNPAIPVERKMFGKFAMAGLPEGERGLPDGDIPFVKEGAEKSEYTIAIGGTNFGCGSSREHAPLCLDESGIQVVIAPFFPRIFFRNCVNGGYLVPFESEDDLSKIIKTDEECEVDIEKNEIRNLTTGETYKLKPLGDILPILEAGNVFEYAKKVGMIQGEHPEHNPGEEPEKD